MGRQNIAVSTDCVIFSKRSTQTKILLIQRLGEPYKDWWALPGGFLEEEEELKAGARRELEEETGLKIQDLTQLKAFGTVGRDPRGRTISVAFMGALKTEEKVEGADDAKDARWFPIDELPRLAFDHREIIEFAFTRFS